MSRGYGKYRRGNCHSASIQFDSLFKENSNRPSAARSAGTIGKWGITSFTSIRTLNETYSMPDVSKGITAASKPVAETSSVPKPKKFFKSRNTEPPDLSPAIYTEKTEITYGNSSKKLKISYGDKSPKQSQKKFFSSKNASEKTVLGSNVNITKRGEAKPPIVLRICHGKSQLLNDSDESESTPTPSSTPSTSTVTSPRNPQRSPSARITRSTRRSMQQDPNCSPAMADTPGEFSLFTSPKKDIDLSPQYIPAEKYEQERKALYATLLGSVISMDPEPEVTPSIDLNPNNTSSETMEEENKSYEEEEEEEGGEEPMEIENETVENLENGLQQVPEALNSSKTNEAQNEILPAPSEEPKQEETNLDCSNTTNKSMESNPVANKLSIEEEWSTESDSDSQSTAPELEVREQKSPPRSTNIEDHKEEILEKILEKPPENPAPVKLVISKKKGSIFKSRSLVPDGGTKKRRALYKHKWCDGDPGEKKGEGASESKEVGEYDEFGFKDDPLLRVTKESEDDEAVSSVKCSKNDKGYYTVVRNVKKAHQIQEIGEFQEFNDDVEYILDTLQDNNPISTRCLSAISLATKCMAPAFRMHVRAHGTVAKFFKALHDATKDQSLGLCTATVMFVLSQDRLNMDLDRDCLELMLNLLESDVSYQQALDVCGLSSAQLEKNKQKVREICGEIQSQGHAMHLNLDNITVGQLAMETLLSLTSKRAGEWFKEELRELGGLEHIMKTICECCRQVSDYVVSWTDALLDKLRKVDRCMRVLENVTHNNEENQTYLLKYNNGVILDTLVKLYRLCDSEIPLYPVIDITDKESAGAVVREALLVTLKVLINLTHHFSKQSMGSTLIGARPGIIDASLHLLLQVPHYIPDQKKFELGVLVLMLLINLIQDNQFNKKLLVEARAPADFESKLPCDKSAVEALIVQFYQWEECARFAERKTDAILDGEKDGEGAVQHKSNEEFIEETVAKLLQKAGTHMEFTFLASYVVMLIGFLIMDNPSYQAVVKQFLKDQNFTDMVEILKKFFNFMNLTASTEASSVSAMKATEKVIKYLEECDKPAPIQQTQSYSECMDLSYTVTH